jgi:hypothetical protein
MWHAVSFLASIIRVESRHPWRRFSGRDEGSSRQNATDGMERGQPLRAARWAPAQCSYQKAFLTGYCGRAGPSPRTRSRRFQVFVNRTFPKKNLGRGDNSILPAAEGCLWHPLEWSDDTSLLESHPHPSDCRIQFAQRHRKQGSASPSHPQ